MKFIQINSNEYGYEEKFAIIDQIIHNKKKLLCENQKKIKMSCKENTFLEKVKQDYDKYFAYIVEQKKNQIKALEMLNFYVEKLQKSASLSENNLIDSKNEQKKILTEIAKIKTNLDEIISDISPNS
jgi:hypothetical protein